MMTSPKHQQVDFLKEIKVLTGMQDLSARHLAAVPEDIPTKKDSARDLELIFTKICEVKFSQEKGTWKGRWCTVCK
jgi:hypothetical protein